MSLSLEQHFKKFLPFLSNIPQILPFFGRNDYPGGNTGAKYDSIY